VSHTVFVIFSCMLAARRTWTQTLKTTRTTTAQWVSRRRSFQCSFHRHMLTACRKWRAQHQLTASLLWDLPSPTPPSCRG